MLTSRRLTSASGILANLEDVNNEVIPMFADAAKQLIDMNNGDALTAVCKTLAFISGYYKTAMSARSLLTG